MENLIYTLINFVLQCLLGLIPAAFVLIVISLPFRLIIKDDKDSSKGVRFNDIEGI